MSLPEALHPGPDAYLLLHVCLLDSRPQLLECHLVDRELRIE
jgi:hypothetical protein